ncbi:MAG: energy-coupling factor ABC transporter permease [Victivallales bacterium]|nr:energy-coupling factor ABC transporter permease [Victivallales bacterium]
MKMHMADALLSPAVGGAMYVVSGVALGYSVKQMRTHFDEKRIPLMGMLGAAVFAAQMINFSIPGTGSSGHVAGALLLACMLGVAPAFIVMASVLLIQCLFFADGGLLAFGCNLFNMGFFGCFLGYQYIFKPLAGKEFSPVRTIVAACIASIVSLELGAFCVTLQTLASGITSLPFGVFAGTMLSIHLAIGLGEGLATGVVLALVHKNVPHFMETKLEPKRLSIKDLTLVFALAALVIGGGLSLIACGDPDGLEWSIERLTGSTELQEPESKIHALSQKVTDATAFLPDYSFPEKDSEVEAPAVEKGEAKTETKVEESAEEEGSLLGTSVSGIVGCLICAVVLFGLAWLITKHKKLEPSSVEQSA